MKVYEMSFRDMDQKMVEIHGMKMVKLLEKMGLKLDNLYGALMYGISIIMRALFLKS